MPDEQLNRARASLMDARRELRELCGQLEEEPATRPQKEEPATRRRKVKPQAMPPQSGRGSYGTLSDLQCDTRINAPTSVLFAALPRIRSPRSALSTAEFVELLYDNEGNKIATLEEVATMLCVSKQAVHKRNVHIRRRLRYILCE